MSKHTVSFLSLSREIRDVIYKDVLISVPPPRPYPGLGVHEIHVRYPPVYEPDENVIPSTALLEHASRSPPRQRPIFYGENNFRYRELRASLSGSNALGPETCAFCDISASRCDRTVPPTRQTGTRY